MNESMVPLITIQTEIVKKYQSPLTESYCGVHVCPITIIQQLQFIFGGA